VELVFHTPKNVAVGSRVFLSVDPDRTIIFADKEV
jgi:hypothetical protein